MPTQPSASAYRTVWPAILGLVGLDYFSTLAYQPSIAAEAAGKLAPLATAAVVLLTLLGALPVYAYVAGRSPPGQGALGLLERLIHGWRGKFLILVLLGFAATNFVFTRTLSTADAAVHLVEHPNPAWQQQLDDWGRAGDSLKPMNDHRAWRFLWDIWNRQLVTTLLLLAIHFVLWPFFGRRFSRLLVLAGALLVAVFLLLTAIIVGSGLVYLVRHPELLEEWWGTVRRGEWGIAAPSWYGGDAWMPAAMCLWLLPKMALGLSGFEMSLAVVPLLRDDGRGRVARTRRVLLASAVIMGGLLLGSALVTTVLAAPGSLVRGGPGHERALAALAHAQVFVDGVDPHAVNPMFGLAFGTVYDVVTILVLCLAGASVTLAMKSLLPQFLLRFGMEFRWANAIGLMYVVFILINLLVTLVFRASVEAQRSAYAVSVLMLMTGAGLATTLDLKQRGGWRRWGAVPFALITLMFAVMTGAIIVRQPSCLLIAGLFIAAIVTSSIVSRYYRAHEFRFAGFEFDSERTRQLWDHVRQLEYSVLVPMRPGGRVEVDAREAAIRRRHRVDDHVPLIFLEVVVEDASDFMQRPLMEIAEEPGRYQIRVTRCVSVAHVIVAMGREFSKVGEPPEIHFGWSDENPVIATLNFLLFGQGNIPMEVNDLLRRHEPDHAKRPRVVIG